MESLCIHIHIYIYICIWVDVAMGEAARQGLALHATSTSSRQVPTVILQSLSKAANVRRAWRANSGPVGLSLVTSFLFILPLPKILESRGVIPWFAVHMRTFYRLYQPTSTGRRHGDVNRKSDL